MLYSNSQHQANYAHCFVLIMLSILSTFSILILISFGNLYLIKLYFLEKTSYGHTRLRYSLNVRKVLCTWSITSLPYNLILLYQHYADITKPPIIVWGVDSVKSTVTVLEEGDFTEEGGGFNWRGYFCIGGYQFLCRSAF